MLDNNIEFQAISSLATGLIFGSLSISFFFMIFFVMIYEFFVYVLSIKFPPTPKSYDRVFVNVTFLVGWLLGRSLILNENGVQEIWDDFI